MKAAILFSIAIAVAVGMAIFTAQYQKVNPPRVKVLGLCIPKSRVNIVVRSGSPISAALNRIAHLDKTSGSWTNVSFTPREMMKAIPGWTGYRWDSDAQSKLHIGLTVGISADVPMNRGRLTQVLRNIYALKGSYKGARVQELGQSGLYKVQALSEHGALASWELLFVDPRDPNKPPVTAWRKWDAASCGSGSKSQNLPVYCLLNYGDQGVTFDGPVDGKNILLIRQVDAFLSRKVREWRAACHTTS